MTPSEAQRFWECPDSEDAPPAPATDAMIQEFNERHGIVLPDSFVTLYKSQNGGSSYAHNDSFWSIGDDSLALTTLDKLCVGYHEEELVREWMALLGDLKRLVVYFGDGHFYFALNYNDMDRGEPVVWYVDDNGAKRTGLTFEPWLYSDGGVR